MGKLPLPVEAILHYLHLIHGACQLIDEILDTLIHLVAIWLLQRPILFRNGGSIQDRVQSMLVALYGRSAPSRVISRVFCGFSFNHFPQGLPVRVFLLHANK